MKRALMHDAADSWADARPVIEELDVAPAPVASRRSRTVPLVIGLVGALVGWGYLGGSDDRHATVPQGEESPHPTGEVATASVELEAPGRGTLITESTVEVSGMVAPAGRAVIVTVSLGELVLGQVRAEPRGSSLRTVVPIVAPRSAPPIPATLTITTADAPADVLETRSVRLSSVPAVTIDRVTRGLRDGSPVVEVHGSAAIDLARVRVTLAGSGDIQEVLVTPLGDRHVAKAAVLLGVGSWTARLPVHGGTSTTTVLVRWSDGSLSGGSASRVVPVLDLAAPARRPG